MSWNETCFEDYEMTIYYDIVPWTPPHLIDGTGQPVGGIKIDLDNW